MVEEEVRVQVSRTGAVTLHLDNFLLLLLLLSIPASAPTLPPAAPHLRSLHRSPSVLEPINDIVDIQRFLSFPGLQAVQDGHVLLNLQRVEE